MQFIVMPVLILSSLGVLLGAGLAWASHLFRVKVDTRVTAVRDALPGANCGACGHPGCDGLAQAIVEGSAPADACPVGGNRCAAQIASIIGASNVVATIPMVATVICQGGTDVCKSKYHYEGQTDCRAAVLVSGGYKACRYSCLGLGTCMRNCPFGAITMVNEIAHIDPEKCTGCGACAASCPKNVLRMAPRNRLVSILCRATEKGLAVRDACSSGCISCGKCFKACQYHAITMEDNLPIIDFSLCIQCGDCATACPTGAMHDSQANNK